MKGRKAFSLLVLCLGLIWVFCGRAQEEPEIEEKEVSQEVFIPGAEESEQEASQDVFIPGTDSDELSQEALEIESEQAQTEFQDTQETQPVEDEQQPDIISEDQDVQQDEQIVMPEENADVSDAQDEQDQSEVTQESIEPQESAVSAEESEFSEEPEATDQEPEVPMPPDEIMGLDTVDLENPQGNWLFKRVWWERAEAKYEKIKEVVNQVMEKRTAFFAQRSDLDKNVLDPFYIQVGFNQGELQEIIQNLVVQLKSKEQVTREESDSFEKIQDDKKELESLNEDVQKVQKNDEAVDKALLQLVDQINKLRSYEQQAWKDFKSIARVLDDKKARELFYSVDNAWQNVQRIQEYLEQTFSSSFEKLVQEVKEVTQQIESRVNELKNRNIAFKRDGAEVSDQEELESDEDLVTQKPGVIAQFVSMITDGFKNLYNLAVSIVRWPLDLIFGKPAQEESSDMFDQAIEFEESEEEYSGNEDSELPQTTIPDEPQMTSEEDQPSQLEQESSEFIQEEVPDSEQAQEPENGEFQEEMAESTELSDEGQPEVQTEQEVDFGQEEPIADQPESILEPEIEQE